jgi:hypothetical protein
MDEGLDCVGVNAFSPGRGHRRLPPVWSVGVSVSPPLVGTADAMVHVGAAVSVPRVWLARLAAYRFTGLACPKSVAPAVEPPHWILRSARLSSEPVTRTLASAALGLLLAAPVDAQTRSSFAINKDTCPPAGSDANGVALKATSDAARAWLRDHEGRRAYRGVESANIIVMWAPRAKMDDPIGIETIGTKLAESHGDFLHLLSRDSIPGTFSHCLPSVFTVAFWQRSKARCQQWSRWQDVTHGVRNLAWRRLASRTGIIIGRRNRSLMNTFGLAFVWRKAHAVADG